MSFQYKRFKLAKFCSPLGWNPLESCYCKHSWGHDAVFVLTDFLQTAWTGDPRGPGGVGDAGLGGSDARLRPRQEDEPQGGPQAPLLRQALRLPEAGGSLKTYPATPDLV